MQTPPRFIKRVASTVLPDWLLLTIKKSYYARSLRRMRGDEEPEFTVVKSLVKAGDAVADVGANVGVYTKLLSDLVSQNGQVFSFEPVPATFQILQSNAKRLGLHNVRVHPVALSDSERIVTMQVPRYQDGGENYHMAQIVQGKLDVSLKTLSIRTATMDSFFTGDVTHLSFVKCDVEGHELSAVKGSMQLIRRDHPAWLIEISGNPDAPSSPTGELFQLFAAEGYRAYWFRDRVLHLRRAGDASVNYFFLTAENIASLQNTIPISD